LKSLNSKNIVITGSSRGIGRAMAEACAAAGARVIMSSRSAESVALAVNELRSAGLSAEGLAADVSQPGDIKRLMDFAIESGGIDVWINNAGVSGGYRTVQAMPPADIEEVIDTNLLGTFYACRLLIPYFRQRGGIIINLSGRGGRGKPAAYQAAYAASKAAVASLTPSLAAENKGYPVSIHCLMPGMVDTDIFKDVTACPETQHQLVMLPVLLRAFASPMPDCSASRRNCAPAPRTAHRQVLLAKNGLAISDLLWRRRLLSERPADTRARNVNE
jgi:NAD(P)-dependent dehydrogenase (short-subunit alcohol dehydrogenase family)